MLQQINEQEPMRVDRDPDGVVTVHSVFTTIQGEGPFAGHAACFIRLTGCNLQCPGCDTEYTSKAHKATPDHLVDLLRGIYEWESGLAVITGGEPFRQNIVPLVRTLAEAGYTVQIESNGVLYPGDDFPWDWPSVTVVVSPKTAKIHPKTAKLVHAYKYVLSRDSVAPDGLPETALGHPLGGASTVARPPVGWDGPIYLNPMDEQNKRANYFNLRAVADSVQKHKRYIMGVQMHKEIGLP